MGNAMNPKAKFVFCEGGDDLAVIKGVAHSIGLSDLRVEPFLGKDRLREFLAEVQKRPEFSQLKVGAIAVVRDADYDEKAAFTSVRDSLLATGFKPSPEGNGEVVGTDLKIGILVIGPNNGLGMIEDLCLKSVSDRPEFGCVEQYFTCIAEKSPRKDFSSKARIRVWMASHVDYELYVGKAAKEGYWPWESVVFESLKSFLRAL
jgi:hypothetical protein